MLTRIEKGQFVRLFDRGGYVLDFVNADFDAFTMNSIGVPLVQHYGLSKAKSLNAYIDEATDDQAEKLLLDLFEYYEAYFEPEFSDDPEIAAEAEGSHTYDRKNKRQYEKCLALYQREKASAQPPSEAASYLTEKFSSEYLAKQIELLTRLEEESPTDSIGKAKDLIESCCKTILQEQGVAIEKGWDAPRLVKETRKLLKLTDENVTGPEPEAKLVKQILGSLQGLAVGVAEFRNEYGTGHGRPASFVQAPVRHAKLAVGSSLTLCEYLWETYEWRIEKGILKPR